MDKQRQYVQLCADTGCTLEDRPEAMDDKDSVRGSGRFLLIARDDDVDDDENYVQIKLIALDCNTWSHLTVCNQMSSRSLKNNIITNISFTNHNQYV